MLVALLLGLVSGFFASIPIAGPIAVLVLRHGLEDKRREAMYVAIGSSIAEGLYAGAAFAGIGTVLDKFPMVLPVSRVVSAIVLIIVGVYLMVRKTKPGSDATPARSGKKLLVGFWITAVNPTLIVSWAAVVTALHGAGVLHTSALGAIPFGLGVGGGAVLWFVVLLALVVRSRDRLAPKTVRRVVQVGGAVLTIAGVIVGVRAAILFFG
ncbi:hypothetical protein BH09MYX1_BH09MYX1_11040 [soil metagenome]